MLAEQDIENVHRIEEDRKALLVTRARTVPWLFFVPLLFLGMGLGAGAGIGSLPLAILGVLISIGIFHYRIRLPFKEIVSDYKSAIVDSIMTKYHEGIEYRYSPKKQEVKSLVKRSKLIRGISHFYEEDVIAGNRDAAQFYVSEIKLKQSDGNGGQHTKFKGLLFHINIRDWNLPKSRIQSKQNVLQKLFNGFTKNEKFDFWYETRNREAFFASLSPLFPFISHLKKNSKDVRIATDGDDMTILLRSDMKLLDIPKIRPEETLIHQARFDHAVRQINSLLYIVETFTADLDLEHVEEKLDLLDIPLPLPQLEIPDIDSSLEN
ncbi:MAG: hypothetical protein KTR24_16005 [Saprospiraceae bacterium]|nr:hypothetical protein [Saprospiraceae bacterium]